MFYLIVLLLLVLIATINPVAALGAALAIGLQVGLVMLCVRLLLGRTPGFLPSVKGVVLSGLAFAAGLFLSLTELTLLGLPLPLGIALALLMAGLLSGLIFARCLDISLAQALAVALLYILVSGLISWVSRDSIRMENTGPTTTVLTWSGATPDPAGRC